MQIVKLPLDFDGNFISRVFDDVYIDNFFCVLKKLQAIGAKMPEVQFFAGSRVAFGDFVERFDTRHIIYAAFAEIDYYNVGIGSDIELLGESLHRTEEQRAVDFIVLSTFLVDVLTRTDTFWRSPMRIPAPR